MHWTLLFMSNTHLHTPVLQLYQISAIEADLISEHGGFLLSATNNKQVYHFGVQVFNILRVEHSHESLGAYSLAAVLLSHH